MLRLLACCALNPDCEIKISLLLIANWLCLIYVYERLILGAQKRPIDQLSLSALASADNYFEREREI